MLAGWQRAVSHGAVTRAGDLRGRRQGTELGRQAPGSCSSRSGRDAAAGQRWSCLLVGTSPTDYAQQPSVKERGIHIPRIFTVPVL